MQLGCTPGPFNVAVLSFILAECVGSRVSALPAEGKDELLLDVDRKDWKTILRWTLDDTLDSAKVLSNVLESADDDFRVSNGILVMLVDSGVQGNDVAVMNVIVT